MILGVREEETVGLSGSFAPVSDWEDSLCDTICWFRIKVLYGCSTAFECEIFRNTSIGIILCRLRSFSQVETNDDMEDVMCWYKEYVLAATPLLLLRVSSSQQMDVMQWEEVKKVFRWDERRGRSCVKELIVSTVTVTVTVTAQRSALLCLWPYSPVPMAL